MSALENQVEVRGDGDCKPMPYFARFFDGVTAPFPPTSFTNNRTVSTERSFIVLYPLPPPPPYLHNPPSPRSLMLGLLEPNLDGQYSSRRVTFPPPASRAHCGLHPLSLPPFFNCISIVRRMRASTATASPVPAKENGRRFLAPSSRSCSTQT